MRSSGREAAKTRRRWVTLAEVVGLAGVVIAALSLWLTWSQRRTDEADRAAEQATTARAKTVIRFEGAATHDGDALTLADPDHKVDTIDLRLPASLSAERTTGLPTRGSPPTGSQHRCSS